MMAAALSDAVTTLAIKLLWHNRPGTVNDSLCLTEQSAIISAKYAKPHMVRRNLESLVAATLESTLLDVEGLGDAAEPAYVVLGEVAILVRCA